MSSDRVDSLELPRAGARRSWLRAARAGVLALGVDAERGAALADSWRALWSSRALVFGVGVATVLVAGFGPARGAFDAAGITRGFGSLGDVLAAPTVRWDSAWYLVIAHFGYHPELGSFSAGRAAFFPLYPLAIAALARVGIPAPLGGVLISLAALWAALYGIHRLVTLELATRAGGARREGLRRREVARLAVLLCAFAPMAFFLSAVYSESLYLALSVGLFWCARQGRWGMAGLVGALAAASRSAGVLLIVPALVLYLYGPREDRTPDSEPYSAPRRDGERGHARRGDARPSPAPGGPWVPARAALAALAPRYRLRRDVLWLALIPAGLALYLGYLAAAGGNALTPFHAQQVWGRHFAGPFGGIWVGARAAFEGARVLLGVAPAHLRFLAAGTSPSIQAAHNLLTFAFLVGAIVAAIGVWRALPRAYGLYVVAALALPLSLPASSEPLMSLPRFLVVMFPLNVWLALRLAPAARARAAVLVLSALALAFFTAEFSTWHWVA